MKREQDLKWGESVWDDFSREQLLREVQRKHAALSAISSIVRGYDRGDDDPFWGKSGRGGAALEMMRQAMHFADNRTDLDSENAYRAFWRYAYDLLFEPNGYEMIGFGWVVCPVCGTMLGDRDHRLEGTACTWTKDCTGTYRKIEWGDLSPALEKDGAS